jgi:hypothetical protein
MRDVVVSKVAQRLVKGFALTTNNITDQNAGN